MLDRQVAGDQCGPAPDAFFDDLEQIPPLAVAEGRQAPIVEDQKVRLPELLEELAIRAIGARAPQLIAEEARQPGVAHRVAVAAGALA